MSVKRKLRFVGASLLALGAFVLAGCRPIETVGYLPGFVDPNGQAYEEFATNHTERVAGLWVNSWIVLLIVGVITWTLIAWAAIVYRRRKSQSGLPVQMRYNMPMEILYTVIPLVLVLGFFALTARDQVEIERPYADADVTVTATGKQWSWDFEYEREGKESVYTFGIQGQPAANGDIDQDELPTLVLPVGERVTINLESRDVIHSFWVIDFLYKKDQYPGRDNSWSFTPTREGTYAGKCAEFCGEFHSLMLFNVKVVSPAEYEEYLDSLEARGNVGPIQDEYDRLSNLPGTGPQKAEGGEE